jgi:hypothetical protein
MIIWSGFGFLILVVAFGAFLLSQLGIDVIFGAKYYEMHHWTIGVAMFLAAIGCWLLDLAFRGGKARVVVDQATGQEIVLRRRHSLFFIPTHIWVPIFVLIGIVLCVMEFFK